MSPAFATRPPAESNTFRLSKGGARVAGPESRSNSPSVQIQPCSGTYMFDTGTVRQPDELNDKRTGYDSRRQVFTVNRSKSITKRRNRTQFPLPDGDGQR